MAALLLAAVVLACLALCLWARSLALRRRSGLPPGRLIYADTAAWQPCEKHFFSDAYRLTGRPDYLVSSRRGVIPVEVKSGRAPSQPYRSHVLQLTAYCLLVEEAERRAPPYGILKYDDRAFQLAYTPALRADLLRVLGCMHRDLGASDVDRDHQEHSRCQRCGFRRTCRRALE